MSPLHELAKQVFRTYILDNDEMDLMREAMRLMQPVGTCADDEQVLVTALATARAADKPDSSAFWDLHAVNSHAENIWRDYYVLHRRRLDELVHAYLAAGSSSACSTSGSFSDAGSLSAASSPPTSVEDASDAEDKGLNRSRQPSAAPEECLASGAPSRASRATSQIRSLSPTVILETHICDDRMNVFLEGDSASVCEAVQEAVELYPAADATVLASCAEVQSPAELYSEPMEEDIIENEAVIQPSPQSSPAPSASSRLETPPLSSSSTSSSEISTPQTPSTSRSSRSPSVSPRRSERERKFKKRPDEAASFHASKPSSTASGSSGGSASPTKSNRASPSPAQTKYVDDERHRYIMDEKMGRAGGKVTLGDLKACARFFAEYPDAASLTRDGRGKAFYKLHRQRTWKAWTHVFNRFESTIAELAEVYRSSSPSA